MKCTSTTCRDAGAGRDRGFAAVTAVFILVVLAALGVALLTISGGQQRSSAFDTLGSRAYQAARAGTEFGIYQALRNSSCPASTVLALPGGLSDFSVRVECASSQHTEAAPPAVTMYQITATACNRAVCPAAADATYVERQLRVVVGSSAP